MRFTYLKRPGSALAVCYAAAVFLSASSSAQMMQGCSEPSPALCVWQAVEVSPSSADQGMAEAAAARTAPSEVSGPVDLHVPDALVQALLMEESPGHSVELRVPTELPLALAAEDWE